jgi:23S rRNA pseudouridine1911/1915/1917 synthase
VVFSIVGRLDKWTSGVVVLAKSATAHSAMQRGWPKAEKDYLAVVRGRVDVAGGVIDLPLGTDPADRRRRIVRPDGAPSVTTFERIDYDASLDRSLMRCRLVTGRRHQIRVHLAARGWPVVGDALYGEPHQEFERHALHAWRLTFRHPRTSDIVRLRSALPASLVSLYPNSDTVVR